MNKHNIKRSCGIVLLNGKNEFLLIKPFNSNFWEFPSWEHKDNELFLSVALRGLAEKTGIDMFNYKEQYFRSLQHVQFKNEVFVPYSIKENKSFDNMFTYGKLWSGEPDVSSWEYFSKAKAGRLISNAHRLTLKQIK